MIPKPYTLETTENEKFHEKVRDLHAFDEVYNDRVDEYALSSSI